MDKSALSPVYGMWHVPFWQTTTFYLFIAALGVLIFLFVAWYGIRAYRASKKKKLPAWDVALNELAEISQQLERGKMLGKTFYFRLSWIFKRYLTDRYSFEVYGKTDAELLLYLESTGLAQDRLQDFVVIFEGSSAIKFAQKRAVQERMKRDLATSIELIKKTIPEIQEGQ